MNNKKPMCPKQNISPISSSLTGNRLNRSFQDIKRRLF